MLLSLLYCSVLSDCVIAIGAVLLLKRGIEKSKGGVFMKRVVTVSAGVLGERVSFMGLIDGKESSVLLYGSL